MTPLAGEILKVLQAEVAYPPLSAESLSRVLWVTGYGRTENPIPVAAIEGALSELMAAGKVERVHSIRLGPRYRAMSIPTLVSK